MTAYMGYRFGAKDLPQQPKKALSERADLKGARFGRLIVRDCLGVTASGGYRWWGCVCDCGRKIAVRSRELKRGHTKSCGCLQTEARSVNGGKNRMSTGIAAANVLYYSYKKSARERGHAWELEKTLFLRLTTSPCAYCGQEPSQVMRGNSAENCNGFYTYNGIDRIDNSKGYIPGNVRACCKQCNLAKNTLSEREFFAWIDRISAVRSKNKSAGIPAL